MLDLPRNVYVLALCQAFSMGCGLVVGLLGGIVGSTLAPDPNLVTLPVTCSILGTALTSVPAALLMRRVGRRRGFMTGALIAASAGLLGIAAISVSSFLLFCLATLCVGGSLAFMQQYRFAAAECVAPLQISQAISVVLLGTIGAALTAPLIAMASSDWLPYGRYSGSFGALTLMALAALLLLTRFHNPPATPVASDHAERRLGAIARSPDFIVAVLAAAVGYGVMAFIMTATPVSMHVVDGHSLGETTWVVQSHVLAMYLPSLISGRLIVRFGALPMMLAGLAANAACVAFGLGGHSVHDYWAALVMLGVGWNFLFVAGTTLLTRTIRGADRFKAQATNDSSVFACAALGSLSAGGVLHQIGWLGIQLSVLPFILAVGVAVVWLMGRRSNTVKA